MTCYQLIDITVILGDSATGKTTLIDLLSTYSRFENGNGIRLESDVPCVVYTGDNNTWKQVLMDVKGSIIFIDEDHSFVFGEEFAGLVKESDNYYVIITRRPLYNLPYSIEEVYGIRTTGKYHYPEKIYHEFYHIYSNEMKTIDGAYTFLLEDSQ